jgi:hypothetical protein
MDVVFQRTLGGRNGLTGKNSGGIWADIADICIKRRIDGSLLSLLSTPTEQGDSGRSLSHRRRVAVRGLNRKEISEREESGPWATVGCWRARGRSDRDFFQTKLGYSNATLITSEIRHTLNSVSSLRDATLG